MPSPVLFARAFLDRQSELLEGWPHQPSTNHQTIPMSGLALTLVVTLVMFIIVGVQDSTARVIRVLLASAALLAITFFFSPNIAAALSGEPARSPSGQLLRDDNGLPLYSQAYITAYQSNHAALTAITYLGSSLVAASILLLFYRLFIAGVDTASRPPIPRERTSKK